MHIDQSNQHYNFCSVDSHPEQSDWFIYCAISQKLAEILCGHYVWQFWIEIEYSIMYFKHITEFDAR